MKIKILFLKWNAFMEKAIEKSMKQLDIEYDVFVYHFQNAQDWDKNDDFVDRLILKLNGCGYDAVFSVNFVPLISDVCHKLNIKYVSWVYDSPIHIRRIETLKNSCNRIYFFDRGQVHEYQKDGLETAFHMPLAVDAELFDKTKINSTDVEEYGSDISFVGQLYKSDYSYLIGPLDEYQRGFLEGVINAQLKIYGAYFLNEVITEDFIRSINERFHKASKGTFQIIKEELVYAMACEVTGRERYTALALLSSRYHVNLYTKDNDDRLLKTHFKGYVDYYSQMPKVFRLSKINLNISLKTIRTGIPLRVLDIMGCGGFLITNYQEELMDYFEPGVDLVVYESLEDMVLKVEYYLKNEEERQKIAMNGYHKVKGLFDFESSLRIMMNDINI